MFLRKTSRARDPLAVTMTGVRMGERLLQIGMGDARLAVQLAARPGMSGHAAIVTASESMAARARAAAADAGALVDVQVAPASALPFADQAFDVAVIHAAGELLAPLPAAARGEILAECLRVLRPGGRVVALDAGTRTGLAALIRRASASDPQYEAAGGTIAALEAAGFTSVRLLADREGYRFIEGIKR
jgi:ubiquinone/menaquinone biosynthesis C-methylase UbiE